MSTKLMVTVDLEIIKNGNIYFVYDSNRQCMIQDSHLKRVEQGIKNIFKNSLGLDVTTRVGKTTRIQAEPLAHEGRHL